MKIIIVGPAHPLRGGIADTNESLCRAFQKRGHDAELVSFSLQYPAFLFPGKTQFSTDPTPTDLTIHTLINSVNPINWVRTAQKINQLQPDLVIFRYWLPFMGPCLGTIARRLDKTISKLALCDNVIPHESRIGDHAFTKYFVAAFDGFITMSKTVFAELETFTDKPKIYFPHPINDNLGQKLDKQQAREQLGLKKNGNYLLFFGLVRQYKGLDLMLRAMGDSRVKNMDMHLLVVGEFYDPIEKYEIIIEEEGIENYVTLHNEFIPTNKIKTYFSAVDMVTQTYHTASQSGITQIAMHFDCPMLVTDVGGLSEIVAHQTTGYVTPKSPQAIATALVDFYQNERYPQYSAAVAQEKEKYSWTSFCQAVEDNFL